MKRFKSILFGAALACIVLLAVGAGTTIFDSIVLQRGTDTFTGNGAGLSNAVVIAAGTGISSTPSGNGRTYTLASTGGGAGLPVVQDTMLATNKDFPAGIASVIVRTNWDVVNNQIGLEFNGSDGRKTTLGFGYSGGNGTFHFGSFNERFLFDTPASFWGMQMIYGSGAIGTAVPSFSPDGRILYGSDGVEKANYSDTTKFQFSVPVTVSGAGNGALTLKAPDNTTSQVELTNGGGWFINPVLVTNSTGWTMLWPGGSTMESNRLTGTLTTSTNGSLFITNLAGISLLYSNGLLLASNATSASYTFMTPQRWLNSNGVSGNLMYGTNGSLFLTNFTSGTWTLNSNGVTINSNANTSASTTFGSGWNSSTNTLLGTWLVNSNGNARFSGGTTNIGPLSVGGVASLQGQTTLNNTLIMNANILMSAGAKLSQASGSNQRAGNATLVGGTVTVSNTGVTANTIVLLSRKTAGGTLGTGGYAYTVSAATSFTINSVDTAGVLSILDTSVISYLLVEVP